MASSKGPYLFPQLLNDIATLPPGKATETLTDQLEEAHNSGVEDRVKTFATQLQSRPEVAKLPQQAQVLLKTLATHGTSSPETRDGKCLKQVKVQPSGSDRSETRETDGVDVKPDKSPNTPDFGKTYTIASPTQSASEPSQSKSVKGISNIKQKSCTMPVSGGNKSAQKRQAPSPHSSSTNTPPGGAQATPNPQIPAGDIDEKHPKEIIKTNCEPKRVYGIFGHANQASPPSAARNKEEKAPDCPPSPELAISGKMKKEMEEMNAENEALAKDVHDLKNRLDSNEKAHKLKLAEMLNEQEKLEQDKTTYQAALENSEQDRAQLKVELEASRQQISELTSSLGWHERRRLVADQTIKSQREGYENEMKKLKEECDDLKTRFSKLAGEKLHQNNPDIADLSDADRAVKLAERFSCLYDDEWTDAFQEQTETLKYPARDAIQNLLETLLSSYRFCHEVVQEQLKSIDDCLTHPCSRSSGSASKSTAVITEVPPEQQNSDAVGTDDKAKPKGQATPGASTKDVSDGNEPIADSAEPLDNQSESSKETSQPKSKKPCKKCKKDKNGLDKSREDNTKGPEGKDANGKVKATNPAAKDQTELEKCLIKLRRERRDQTSEDVQQAFVMKMKSETTSPKTLKDHEPYWRKCADLCWRMIIQDPPLWLDTSAQPGTKVSLEMYRCYAATGDVVEYLVWPPMHIQGGGLVAKGVFQPVVQPKAKKGKR